MSTPPWVSDLFAALDANDIQRFASHLTPDVEFRLGSREPIQGRSALVPFVQSWQAQFESTYHDIQDCWQVDGTVICLGEVAYRLSMGREFVIPFVDVFRLKDNRIAQYLVYVDHSPLAEAL